MNDLFQLKDTTKLFTDQCLHSFQIFLSFWLAIGNWWSKSWICGCCSVTNSFRNCSQKTWSDWPILVIAGCELRPSLFWIAFPLLRTCCVTFMSSLTSSVELSCAICPQSCKFSLFRFGLVWYILAFFCTLKTILTSFWVCLYNLSKTWTSECGCASPIPRYLGHDLGFQQVLGCFCFIFSAFAFDRSFVDLLLMSGCF